MQELLRTDLHGNLIWNWDVAGAPGGGCKRSVIPAGWKDEASTYVLCPQVVLVLQFHKTSQSGSVEVSEGEDNCDLSQY